MAGAQAHIALRREPVGDRLNMRVDAPNLLNNNDGGVAAVSLGLGQVPFHGAAVANIDVNPACRHFRSPNSKVMVPPGF